jgi:hypothetical protein
MSSQRSKPLPPGPFGSNRAIRGCAIVASLVRLTPTVADRRGGGQSSSWRPLLAPRANAKNAAVVVDRAIAEARF